MSKKTKTEIFESSQEKKKHELEEKNNDLINDIKRLQAEFDNFRKREEQNRTKMRGLANQNLIEKLIPVLDTFELAINSSPEGKAKQGMEMIYTQFLTIVTEEGLTKINPINEEFNPEEHEAIMVVQGEEEKIVEVLQPGYKLKDNIIRHAKVKITKKCEVKENE
jgi:molecular chaperone GrpE